jgi:hypothetical protein
MQNQTKKISRRTGLILVSVLLLASLALGGYVYARYRFSQSDDLPLRAEAFYFESDLLEEPDTIGSYGTRTLASGVTTIAFELRNHADALRFTTSNISYTATIYKKGELTPLSTTSGTLAGNSTSAGGVTFTVSESGTYTVVATASEPYSKTLKADFVVTVPNPYISYSVVDKSGNPFVSVIVQSNDYAGQITLTWPVDVHPNNASPLLAIAVDGTPYKYTVAPGGEYAFNFFKDDPTKDHSTAENKTNFKVKQP